MTLVSPAEELVLDALLLGRGQAGVEVGGFPAVRAQEFGGDLGFVPRGAEDDRAAGRALGQAIREQIVDALQLVRLRDGLHLEAAGSRARRRRQKNLKSRPVSCLEEGEDFLPHVLLGRGGEAGDGRNLHALLLGELPDEPAGVEVVGPEVVPPFGETMGLVEHPAADLALGDGLGEGAVAQLLRRDVEQRDVAQPDPAQHVAALRRREQAVEGRGKGRAGAPDQAVHLVLHQGLQRGEDDGEDAAAVVAHQGRELEAERLAAAGGQNRQQRFVAPCRPRRSPAAGCRRCWSGASGGSRPTRRTRATVPSDCGRAGNRRSLAKCRGPRAVV